MNHLDDNEEAQTILNKLSWINFKCQAKKKEHFKLSNGQ